MTLWSGRVGTGLAPEVWEFLLADDSELLPYDLAGTFVHAGRLHAAGLLTDEELHDAEARLAAITVDDLEASDEDVHSAIERLLGDVGRKIHAGRSRNDQVATAFRLYVADACNEADAALGAFANANRARSRSSISTHASRWWPSVTGIARWRCV